ncbi:ECF subfamily RNA polymerase sigma-24 subunit [Seminavis robusta]|uniref:ECF subfamily RNA polymerase sigma-24 subunit n=1 Tax=Seminavis robusta TaxID=568900 RepID=A0A9N8EPU6_9STRA|nr:ECF subfamily RNA polymerase sigma-24 subunit [Seminavis robusta]|eukprot:Sro1726_g293840.1 ECF subfamily RNA polymerase sigma-24 subunit (629) ;mRNA; r:11543-13506
MGQRKNSKESETGKQREDSIDSDRTEQTVLEDFDEESPVAAPSETFDETILSENTPTDAPEEQESSVDETLEVLSRDEPLLPKKSVTRSKVGKKAKKKGTRSMVGQKLHHVAPSSTPLDAPIPTPTASLDEVFLPPPEDTGASVYEPPPSQAPYYTEEFLPSVSTTLPTTPSQTGSIIVPEEDSLEESAPPTQTRTEAPSGEPALEPTAQPTRLPTRLPKTATPTEEPTFLPTTEEPTILPTEEPTIPPTAETTILPTEEPTILPSTAAPSVQETFKPSMIPTEFPSQSGIPVAVTTDEQAVALYEFTPGEVSEPDSAEVFRLQIATTAFYIGIFSEHYSDNPDTTFLNIVATVADLRYDPDAEPPIQVDWDFRIFFDANSNVLPTQQELLALIYADEDALNEYVEIYLHNSDDVWASVIRVTYSEAPEGELPEPERPSFRPTRRPSGQPTLVATLIRTLSPTLTPPEEGLDFPTEEVEATLRFGFSSDDDVEEPTEEDLNRLESALSAFYTALYTQVYLDEDDTNLATVVATVVETSFNDRSNEPLQVNMNYNIFFSHDTTVIPSSETLFEIMERNSEFLQNSILEDFEWMEDNIWNQVSSVTVEPLTSIRRRRRQGGKKNKKKQDS